MKKQLIIGSLLAFAGITNAQTWGGSASQTGNAYRTGNVGVGMTTPAYKLDIATAVADDGLRITQTTNNAAMLVLSNLTASGHDWALHSSGTGNSIGGGHLSIYDLSATGGAANRMFIHGTSGEIGFGTLSPGAKVDVLKSVPSPGQGIDVIATNSHLQLTTGVYSMGGALHNGYGVKSVVDSYLNESFGTGVYGRANNGQFNTGGSFIAAGGNQSYTQNFGVYAEAYGTTGVNHAVHAVVTGPVGAGTWAGYFVGNVYRSGTDNFTSDRKLKNDIKPLANALEKIKLLKPSTYTFKTDDNLADMHLPSGKQMGLIAQELEEVFPELVTNMPALTKVNDKGQVVPSSPEFKSVQYISLIPVLIGGIQEQQQTIEQQAKVNAYLQKQLDEQNQLIQTLSQKVAGTTGINSVNGVENGFQMSQNEPNPFTHETVVKYTLPQTVNSAFMAVYDLTGKQITSLPINQKGSSSLAITSEKLAAGIYIYSIVADGKVIDSKRMIVAQN